jgi:serine protease Do
VAGTRIGVQMTIYLNTKKNVMTCAYAVVLCFMFIFSAHANGPESIADLADGLLDAVVNISTSQRVDGNTDDSVTPPNLPDGSPFKELFDDFFKKQNSKDKHNNQNVESLGSGFVIDAGEGIIISNHHVVADADAIEVNFTNGKKLKATLIGKDLKTDLAVLKVDPKQFPLTAVKFGDSDTARIGDWVMAIGNPFGLGGTVTVGIISARNRDINSGPYDRFIQTDAAINKGNSGGPLFNMKGEVIGVNSVIISPTGGSIGLAFSIPSELAVGVVTQLRQFGETRRGWLGVRIQYITDDIAESLGLKNSQGALIAGIIKDGPITTGSLQIGDVVKKFGTQEIKEARDLSLAVSNRAAGESVDLVILRKNLEMSVKVTLGRLEDSEKINGQKKDGDKSTPEITTLEILGMSVQDLDEVSIRKFGIDESVTGVLITHITPNSLGSKKKIQVGDVISEVGQKSVKSTKDFVARVEELKRLGRKTLLLLLASNTGEMRFLTLKID